MSTTKEKLTMTERQGWLKLEELLPTLFIRKISKNMTNFKFDDSLIEYISPFIHEIVRMLKGDNPKVGLTILGNMVNDDKSGVCECNDGTSSITIDELDGGRFYMEFKTEEDKITPSKIITNDVYPYPYIPEEEYPNIKYGGQLDIDIV